MVFTWYRPPWQVLCSAHVNRRLSQNGSRESLRQRGTRDARFARHVGVIPNCIARSTRDKCTYVGAELNSCKDFGELAFRRPVEKGFIVNWEAEKAIWEHEFMGDAMGEGLRVGTHNRELMADALANGA